MGFNFKIPWLGIPKPGSFGSIEIKRTEIVNRRPVTTTALFLLSLFNPTVGIFSG